MNQIAFIAGMPGGAEILLIFFILLLLFGAKKLPELSRSLGRSLSEFKKGKADLEKELREVKEEPTDSDEPAVRESKTSASAD